MAALRILHVEDLETDAALISRVLRQAGMVVEIHRVDTEEAFLAALDTGHWDAIISDCELPGFSGARALVLCRQRSLTLPFIVVSGAIGEEEAANLMRMGADDFISKRNLARLQPALVRELREAEARGQRQRMRAQLELMSMAVTHSANMVIITDAEGVIEYVNPKFTEVAGYDLAEVAGKTPRLLKSALTPPATYPILWQTIKSGQPWHSEFANCRKDGSLYVVNASISPVFNAEGVITHFVAIQEDVTRRREAEEALGLSEGRFRAIAASTRDAILVVDETGVLVSWNPGAEAIFGYPAEVAVGMPLIRLIPEETQPVHNKAFARAVAQRSVSAEMPFVEVMARHRHGHLVPIEMALSSWVAGGKLFFNAIVRDITQRRRAEGRLRALAEGVSGAVGADFFTSLVAHMAMSLDADFAMVAELVDGREVRSTALYADGIHCPPRSFALAHGGLCTEILVQGVFACSDGLADRFPADPLARAYRSVTGTRLVGEAGETTGLLVVLGRKALPDVEEALTLQRVFAARAAAEMVRLRYEQSLRESEDRAVRASETLLDALDSISEGFTLFDKDDRLILYNRRFLEMLPNLEVDEGMTFEDLVRRIVALGLIDEPDLDDHIARRMAYHRNLGAPFEAMVRDGRTLLISERRTREGGTVSVRTDVTQIKAAERHLMHAQKMETVGQLTGGVAHDFNNILAVVMGNLQCVIEPSFTAEQKTGFAEGALRAAQRGADLINRLLTFSRRQVLQPQVLDVAVVVAELVLMAERTLGEKIAVAVAVDAGVDSVNADRGQLENALMNLVVNARDAMPEGGRIVITAANATVDAAAARAVAEGREGRFVAISVTDDGEGMSPEVMARVCEPFFSTKEVGKGTGLGLSMVYGFVNQSGGFIHIESAPGQGAQVTLYLPAHRHVAAAAAGSDDPGRAAVPLPGRRILVVEDDPDVRATVVAMLDTCGYVVFNVADASAAVEILEREPVEVVLSDVIMPGPVQGPDLARLVRAMYPAVKVMLMSGYAAERLVDMPNDVPLLVKPFNTQQAVALVEALCG